MGFFGIARLGSAKPNPPQSSKSLKTAPSAYIALLKPLDIYAPPPGATKLIGIVDLYKLVRTQGVTLKVANEELSTARQTQKSYRDGVLPTLALGAGESQSWIKTKTDRDRFDNYTDREGLVQSRNTSYNLGLTLSGTPIKGLNYSFTAPEYTTSKVDPDLSQEQPQRLHNAGWTGKIDIALLKDSPIFTQSLTERKRKLEWTRAREVFKSETMKAISAAEKSYYALIQKSLQLAVQRRTYDLAKALHNDVKEKIAAGESSALEAMRSSLQTSQSETDLMASQIEYEAAIEEFRNSLSYDNSEGNGVFPDPKSLNIQVDQFKLPNPSTINEIRKGNSDVTLATLASKGAELDLELARRGTYPNLAFTLSYQNKAPGERMGQAIGDTARPADRAFSIGLSYTQILYNDSNSNTMKQAIVSKQKSDLSVAQAEKTVSKLFNALLKKLEIGGRRLKIAGTSRQMSEEKLTSEYEKFKFGESSVRNVIDSQTEVNAASITEIGARIDMLTGFSDLRTLSGRLPEGITMSYGAATGGVEPE
jgi:outer membrane protein TolC